jgi:formamidopyrimidine-DNA glycosylase
MPELPDVESLRRYCARCAGGQRIERFEIADGEAVLPSPDEDARLATAVEVS